MNQIDFIMKGILDQKSIWLLGRPDVDAISEAQIILDFVDAYEEMEKSTVSVISTQQKESIKKNEIMID